MAKPTNKQLAEQIKKIDEKGLRRHKSMLASFRNLKKEVRDSLAPFHDYLVGQQAIKDNDADKASGFNITPDMIKIILTLTMIIAALVGASKIQ